MIWNFPSALLLLLGIVPLILWLQSLRPRGVKIRTTTLFLWERVLQKQPVGRKMSWLFRKNLLLLLQLLIALLLVAALADPSLLHFGTPRGDLVVVVDLSASMKAKGRSGSRFDDARKELLSLVRSMRSGEKMMVVGAGPAPAVLSSWTENKRRLGNLARSLRATDGPGQVKEAVLFAHAFLRPEKPSRVVVLSDGAFDGARDLPWQSAHLRLILVGEGGENAGITGFDARRLGNSKDLYELMVEVKNFASRPVHGPLALIFDGKKRVEEELRLEGRESRVLIYPLAAPLPAQVEARLEVDDDFSTDNRAFLAPAEVPPVALLYVGPGNPFLQQFFRAVPDLRVTEIDRWAPELHARAVGEYDVVVVDGISGVPVREGNFIFINAVPRGLPLEVRGTIERPRLLPLSEKHPLAAGLRLDDLYIREALRIALKGDAAVLAETREGPLILTLERGRLRAVVLAFDPSASDLPFKVAFPVLMSNALSWLQPADAEFPAAQVRAGSSHPIHLSPVDDAVEIRSPSGEEKHFQVPGSPFLFGDALEVGFYTFRSKSGEGRFAVNLLSEDESDIVPRLRQEDLESPARSEEGRGETGLSLWPSLLGIVLLIFGLELFWAWPSLQGSWHAILCRLSAVAAVFVALVNPSIFGAASALDVVVGVDYSQSVGQAAKTEGLRILDEAGRLRPPDSRVGLLFFAERPVWEFFPRSRWSLSDFAPEVGREETDMEAALQAALAQIPEERQGRLLLISDGNQTRGEVERLIPLLRGRDVPAWVLPVGLGEDGNEVYVRDLVVPSEVAIGEGFAVKARIESAGKAAAVVKLMRDGVVVGERELRLEPGSRWVTFSQSLATQGSHTFALLVEAGDRDALAENNLLEAATKVKGASRVLYLHSGSPARPAARALRAQGYLVVEETPEKAPLSLAELSAYDLLVLDDIPAGRLIKAKMEEVERYVRDVGGGLAVIGGPHSYGAGGYVRTPLERALPVEMRPPARLDLPHVALLFLLDKSGSMGGGAPGASKLDLAKAAAISAADIMNPSDQVGILAFDAEWSWILPFRRVGQGEWLSGNLASVQSDGGTDLYKAMVEAYRGLLAADASIRHLVVLSDGLTEKGQFDALVGGMARQGVTVSTVAIGEDADRDLMAGIARDGKGRVYATAGAETIPQIFTTEALLASRDLLIEGFFQPTVLSSRGPLKGIATQKIPPLRGYVLTYPKPGAELLMRIEKDPLLVAWRYGLGKVAAFTSDLTGRWGREWVKWEGFPQWAGQLARDTMRRESAASARLQVSREGGETKTVVDLISPDGGFVNRLALKGVLASPAGARTVPFRQIAPGRYEGRFAAEQRGVHLLTVYDEKGDVASPLATFPLAAPYPREYRELKPNRALLRRLAEETRGEILDPAKLRDGLTRLLTPDPGRAISAQETWRPIAGLGLFLFLVDLVLRALPAGLGSLRLGRWRRSARV